MVKKKPKTRISKKAIEAAGPSTSKLATVDLDEGDVLEEEGSPTAGTTTVEDVEVLPGMLERTVRRNLARYPDALLLTQVGSFFEVSSYAILFVTWLRLLNE